MGQPSAELFSSRFSEGPRGNSKVENSQERCPTLPVASIDTCTHIHICHSHRANKQKIKSKFHMLMDQNTIIDEGPNLYYLSLHLCLNAFLYTQSIHYNFETIFCVDLTVSPTLSVNIKFFCTKALVVANVVLISK